MWVQFPSPAPQFYLQIKYWIRENEFDVVYSTDKVEFSKYLAEGYDLIEKTE